MRHSTPVVAVAASVIALGACSSGGGSDPESFEEKSSYAIGQNIGRQMVMEKELIDEAALVQGLSDAINERDPRLTDEEIGQVLREFQAKVQLAQQQRQEEQLAENKDAGDAYRAENGAKPGVTTTASGLQYEVLTEADGPKPQSTDRVSVNYVGSLVDGTVFDSSERHGGPATFQVNEVITGWTEALQLMSVGSKYRFVIPSELGYGERGSGPMIGPNATLVFEVELVEIL